MVWTFFIYVSQCGNPLNTLPPHDRRVLDGAHMPCHSMLGDGLTISKEWKEEHGFVVPDVSQTLSTLSMQLEMASDLCESRKCRSFL